MLTLTTVAATENDGFGADTVAATECSAAVLFRIKGVASRLVEVAIHFVELLDGRVQLCNRCTRLRVVSGDMLLLMLLLLLLLPLLVLTLMLELQSAHLLLMQLGFMILLLGLFALTLA